MLWHTQLALELLLLLLLFFIIIIIIITIIIVIVFVVAVVIFQNCKVIVTSLDCCWYNGGTPRVQIVVAPATSRERWVRGDEG